MALTGVAEVAITVYICIYSNNNNNNNNNNPKAHMKLQQQYLLQAQLRTTHTNQCNKISKLTCWRHFS